MGPATQKSVQSSRRAEDHFNPQSPVFSERWPAWGVVARWGRRISATFLDQGFVSGSNFVLSLSLAKLLGPASYGAYSIAFSVFLLLGNLHQALLLEPMLVLQPASYPRRRQEYVGSIIWLHLWISAVLLGLLGVVDVVILRLGHSELGSALTGMTLALPCILLLWTVRSAAYLGTAPGRAAISSAVYCLTLLAGLVITYRSGLLTPLTTFSLMGIAALLSSVPLIKQLRPRMYRTTEPGVLELWRRHARYGRWSMPGVAAQWVENYSYFIIAGTYLGMREAGALAALSCFVLPLTHGMGASSRLILPWLSRMAAERGRASTEVPVRNLAVLFFVCTAGYWVLVSIFGGRILSALYGPAFAAFSPYVPWATLSIVLVASSFPQEVGLRAIQFPSSVFQAYCFSAAVPLLVGAIAVWRFGLPGVFGVTILAGLVHLIVITVLHRRRCRQVEAPKYDDDNTRGSTQGIGLNDYSETRPDPQLTSFRTYRLAWVRNGVAE